METRMLSVRGMIRGSGLRSAAMFMASKFSLNGFMNYPSEEEVNIEITGQMADIEKFIDWLTWWLSPAKGVTIEIIRVEFRHHTGFTIQPLLPAGSIHSSNSFLPSYAKSIINRMIKFFRIHHPPK